MMPKNVSHFCPGDPGHFIGFHVFTQIPVWRALPVKFHLTLKKNNSTKAYNLQTFILLGGGGVIDLVLQEAHR